MAWSAASTAASGGATNVNTDRWWVASAWTSSSCTPGTPVRARSSASSVARSRPSEKLGTHSTRGAGTLGPPQQLAEPAMQGGVPGYNPAGLQHVVRTIEGGHEPAGLADQHDAGGDVPGSQGKLPEGIEVPRGDVGEVERRRAGAPDTPRRRRHRGEL